MAAGHKGQAAKTAGALNLMVGIIIVPEKISKVIMTSALLIRFPAGGIKEKELPPS